MQDSAFPLGRQPSSTNDDGHVDAHKVRFRSQERCPICDGAEDDPRGNGSRCFGWRMGRMAYCTREEFAGNAPFKLDTSTYAHFVQGPCPCGAEHSPAPAPQRAPRGKVESTHVYRTAVGDDLFRVVKKRLPDGAKTFYQQLWHPETKTFKGGLKGVKTVLYHLPELLAADPGETVFIVEGEKDVENLEAMGFVATCNPMGAEKWQDHYSDALRGRRCVVIKDNDEPGRRHVQKVAASLQGKASSLRVLELPGLDEHGDVSDWLKAGGTAERLQELAAAAVEWSPTGEEEAEGDDQPATIPIPWADVAAPDDPFTLAMLHLNGHRHDGLKTLRYHRGEFTSWRAAAWRSLAEGEVKAKLGGTVHDALMQINAYKLDDKSKKKATQKAIGDTMGALKSLTLLDGDVGQPSWIEMDPPFPADEVLPTRNALVHLPGFVRNEPGAVLFPSPAFFCSYSLDYDFNDAAPPPVKWLDFLRTIWSADQASIDTVQEWFGYCLTPDTRQQKILGMIGPKRSGKGTIARILKALIGSENVAGPSLSQLATNFGLASLIAKPVAIIADARLSGRADQAIITEQLLRISGEDVVDVDRKHRDAWTGKLPTRFVIISNELPRLNDPSGALVGRMVLLRFTESFYGREDKGLFNRLLPELPGILLWAIEGWRRLNERGGFIQPDSGQELVDMANDLSSPVSQFVRERCETGPALEVVTGELFDAWKSWCSENGRDHTGNAQSFGRDLTAAFSGIRTSGPVRRGGRQVRVYQGVATRVVF